MPEGEIYKVDDNFDLIKFFSDNSDMVLLGIIIILLFCIFLKYNKKEKEKENDD